MTTDFIQHKETGRNARLSLLPRAMRKNAPLAHKKGLELTRQDGFVDGDADLFDLLERAEDTISAQHGRIEKLEALSTKDELTGLSNRRGFLEVFVRELSRAERGHNKGGLLILIEIENLKTIRGRTGEEAAEMCLKLVASTLVHEIRAMDVGARLSDDEFVLLFSQAGQKETLSRAQKLALRLNNLSFIWKGAEINISASLGMKAYKAGDKAEDIFKQADENLKKDALK